MAEEVISRHDFGAWELVEQLFHRHRVEPGSEGFKQLIPAYAECRCGAVRITGKRWLPARRTDSRT